MSIPKGPITEDAPESDPSALQTVSARPPIRFDSYRDPQDNSVAHGVVQFDTQTYRNIMFDRNTVELLAAQASQGTFDSRFDGSTPVSFYVPSVPAFRSTSLDGEIVANDRNGMLVHLTHGGLDINLSIRHDELEGWQQTIQHMEEHPDRPEPPTPFNEHIGYGDANPVIGVKPGG
ncbi:MAG: hypothetical protein H6858_05745 [Rhodospirillales bacterium]|nr:hypothetical protein [Alphaproteobacteria bacterium]MCB1840652.1 hypothetical protein [Alphaproteobacteria bacterium]MCB9977079.1 hypothetical protein [Rhodospirillales bacterium]